MQAKVLRSIMGWRGRPRIPRARSWPLVGALPDLLRHPFARFIDARDRHGDIYEIDLGVTRWVMLNHPRHLHHVLVDNAANYYKGNEWNPLRSLVGNGLAVANDDSWRRQRRLVAPHFHRQRVAGLVDALVATISAQLDTWDALADRGRPVDVRPHFADVSMRILGQNLFGDGLDPDELATVGQRMAYIQAFMLRGAFTVSLPRWLPMPGARRYRRAIAELDALVAKRIEAERRATSPSRSMIGMLLEVIDAETGAGLSDVELRDEVMTFSIGGYETSSLAFSWIVHFLTQDRALMRKAVAEIDDVLGGRAPRFEDLMRMPYLRALVQETLRARPPAWALPRSARADDEIDGYRIRAGTTLMPTPFGVHHNRELWEEPERFDPSRFATPLSARQKTAYVPFLIGPRQCVAREFATCEIALVTALLLQRFTLTAVPGRVAEPQLAATLRPRGGVVVNLARRHDRLPRAA